MTQNHIHPPHLSSSSNDEVAQGLANGNGPLKPSGSGDGDVLGERSLEEVSFEIRDKVEAFLATEAPTALLKKVQGQVREAMGVIEDALRRYG